MREMKESGIPWIGRIPFNWEVAPLWRTLRRRNEENHPNETVLSLYRDWGVVPKDSRDDNHNVTSLDTATYKFVRIGDFVINKMKAWQGSMAVSGYQGIVSPAYHVCEFITNNVYPHYLHYLLRNPSYLPEYDRLSTGLRVGQWDLSYDDFKHIPHLIPPLPEQQRISDFLDSKCIEIDNIINKTKSSIEEYKRLKQSIITEAVTKGIRGERKMKDSEIEWIGEIPNEWSISKVNRHFHIQLGKMIQPSQVNDSDTYEYYLCAANFGQNKAKYETLKQMWISESDKLTFEAKKGDLMVVEGGDVASCDIIQDITCVLYFQNSLHRVRAIGDCSVEYLRYFLIVAKMVGHIDLICNKATIAHFTKEKFSSLPYILIPKDEEYEIVAHLDKKCSEIDSLIFNKNMFVKELESYKKSLIYEYVTGKKEVEQ